MSQINERLRVACAQMESAVGDPKANLAKHLDWIGRALKKGCDLLVFPELSLTGYGAWPYVPDIARKADCLELRRLAEAADSMKVVVGFIEEGSGGQFYNSVAWLIDGKIAALHRKVNLPTYGNLEEGKYFASGDGINLLDLDGPWQVGTLICADLWNPALVHLAAQQHATMLVAPVASASEAVGGNFSNENGWDLAVRFYAMMYSLPTIMCNWCGQEGKMTYWGGSRIVDENGEILAVAGDGEELLTAEIDYERIRNARFRLPTIRDANPHFVMHEFSRILRDD